MPRPGTRVATERMPSPKSTPPVRSCLLINGPLTATANRTPCILSVRTVDREPLVRPDRYRPPTTGRARSPRNVGAARGQPVADGGDDDPLGPNRRSRSSAPHVDHHPPAPSAGVTGRRRGTSQRGREPTDAPGREHAARPDDRAGAGAGEAVQPGGRRARGPPPWNARGAAAGRARRQIWRRSCRRRSGSICAATELLGGIGTGERFDRNEFITRVMERSGTDPGQATYQARVVFEVLDEAATGGLMERVRDALPRRTGAGHRWEHGRPEQLRPDPWVYYVFRASGAHRPMGPVLWRFGLTG